MRKKESPTATKLVKKTDRVKRRKESVKKRNDLSVKIETMANVPKTIIKCCL